jgi:hypothetical protein
MVFIAAHCGAASAGFWPNHGNSRSISLEKLKLAAFI